MSEVEDPRARWDARHAEAGAPGPPDPFVLRALGFLEREGVPPGRALDLACGTGRHALALLERGFTVEAWDFSRTALERLAREAQHHGLALATRAVDLERDASPPTEPVALALVVDYLHRPLLARLAALVAPAGHVVVTTFTSDHPGEHPRAAFRLAPFELARGLSGFVTLLAEERGGRAGLLARRAESHG